MNKTILKSWTGSLVGALVMLAATARGEWLFQPTTTSTPNGTIFGVEVKDPTGASIPDTMGNHLVDGITGPAFTLTALEGHISTGEGGSVYVWGLANDGGTLQYPGPTLIVNQGDHVSITLKNKLPFPVSLVFPSQGPVTASDAGGSTLGLLTLEANPGTGGVTYSFIAANPGTYLYNSGTRQDLQVEMGMVGAIIVRPTLFSSTDKTTWSAYATPDSRFDQEFLFLLTEMDPNIHTDVEHQMLAGSTNPDVDTSTHNANYWFINGRTGPDTMMMAGTKALPAQPYDAFPTMHPGQTLLMRMVGAGRDPHPFHHHANHALNIARNGRLLQTSPAAGRADLAYLTFTIPTFPGETTDATFTWTGEGIGWDVYGHAPGDPLRYGEKDQAHGGDHGKPFPTVLPTEQDMDFGAWYGGSPFLGTSAPLPPGIGGFDPTGGFIYMWHSHAEREIVNNNVFPGGMLTMLLVEPWAK